MAKAGKNKKKDTQPAPEKVENSTSIADMLEQPKIQLVLFGLLFLFLLFLYRPIVFGGMEGNGGDVLSNIGNTKQIKQIEAETGIKPLWNPYMFAGTPIYHRHNAISYSVDSLIWTLDGLIDWRIWYLLLGAVGICRCNRLYYATAFSRTSGGRPLCQVPSHCLDPLCDAHISDVNAAPRYS